MEPLLPGFAEIQNRANQPRGDAGTGEHDDRPQGDDRLVSGVRGGLQHALPGAHRGRGGGLGAGVDQSGDRAQSEERAVRIQPGPDPGSGEEVGRCPGDLRALEGEQQSAPFDELEQEAQKRAQAPEQSMPDKRPTHFLKGTLTSVDCSRAPAAVLTVDTGAKSLKLRTADYKSLL